MRNRLWISFHLGTVAVLALLTTLNVLGFLRPFASAKEAPAGALQSLGLASVRRSNGSFGSSHRSPASVDTVALEQASKNPLKTVQVGCEPNLRLRVFETVRQVRLQFDSCKEEVGGVLNSTNGFEATLFGTSASRAEQVENERALAAEPAEGTFTSPTSAAAKAPKRGLASAGPKTAKRGATPQTSTDYISLAAGQNQIKILRAGQEQLLNIERK
ncbi:hypothetical protein BH10BDE1_BH10BDE1_18430 [soil metagenome]